MSRGTNETDLLESDPFEGAVNRPQLTADRIADQNAIFSVACSVA